MITLKDFIKGIDFKYPPDNQILSPKPLRKT
jgi:hypothetical protein